jgi:hypothetical protein
MVSFVTHIPIGTQSNFKMFKPALYLCVPEIDYWGRLAPRARSTRWS